MSVIVVERRLLKKVLKGQQKIMAAIDDLKTAFGRLSQSVSAEIAAVSAKLASLPNANDPAIQEVATSLNAVSDTLDKETASLTA